VVIPGPDNARAHAAVSALVQAMHDLGVYALVRYTLRSNGKCSMGFLKPVGISKGDDGFEDGNIPHHFHLNQLPFSEDWRHFGFESFEKSRHAPSSKQCDAAEAVINAMDLDGDIAMNATGDAAASVGCEANRPIVSHHLFNPLLQRFYNAVERRALQQYSAGGPEYSAEAAAAVGDASIASAADNEIATSDFQQQDLHAAAVLQKHATEALADFKKVCPLARPTDKKKETNWYMNMEKDDGASKPSNGDDSSDYYSSNKRQRVNGVAIFGGVQSDADTLEKLKRNAVDRLRPETALSDFDAMCSNRTVDLVDTAIAQMQDVIWATLRSQRASTVISGPGAFVSRTVVGGADEVNALQAPYQRVVSYIKALRRVCQTEDALVFNSFLSKLKAALTGSAEVERSNNNGTEPAVGSSSGTTACASDREHVAVWKALIAEKVTLLTEEDNPESEVTLGQAAAFISHNRDDSPLAKVRGCDSDPSAGATMGNANMGNANVDEIASNKQQEEHQLQEEEQQEEEAIDIEADLDDLLN